MLGILRHHGSVGFALNPWAVCSPCYYFFISFSVIKCFWIQVLPTCYALGATSRAQITSTGLVLATVRVFSVLPPFLCLSLSLSPSLSYSLFLCACLCVCVCVCVCVCMFVCVFVFEANSHAVGLLARNSLCDEVGLELLEILLPQPPTCWEYRCELPHLVYRTL